MTVAPLWRCSAKYQAVYSAPTSRTPGGGPRLRFSLRTKWTLALLLTSGLPLLLCAYVLIRIQALGLEVAEQEREVAMIDHIAQLVRGSLGEGRR